MNALGTFVSHTYKFDRHIQKKNIVNTGTTKRENNVKRSDLSATDH